MASFMNGSSQGCNTFVTVEKRDNETKRINERLKQWSANPVVYTRVSCFLPWISEQYNLSYDDDTDDDCDDAGTDTVENVEFSLVIRQWNDINPGTEFRFEK